MPFLSCVILKNTQQERNIQVIAIGVGKDVNREELKAIAMNDTKHVFMVNEYKDLVTILDDLLKESCNRTGK